MGVGALREASLKEWGWKCSPIVFWRIIRPSLLSGAAGGYCGLSCSSVGRITHSFHRVIVAWWVGCWDLFLPPKESLAKILCFALGHKVKMSAGLWGLCRDFQKLFWTRTQTIPQHLCILKLLVDVKGLFWSLLMLLWSECFALEWCVCSGKMYEFLFFMYLKVAN